MASGPFLNTGGWKTLVTANDSTAQEMLGSIRFENGKIFRYVLAGGTIAASDAVKSSGTTGTTVITTTAAANQKVVGVAETAITNAQYGWITVYGKATCKVVVSTAAGAVLDADSGTAGTLKLAVSGDLNTGDAVAMETGVAAGSLVFLTCL